MEDGHKNIEDLLRDAFDGFEAEVSDNSWANIQKGMSKPFGPQFNAPDATSFFGKLSTTSRIASVATVVGIAALVTIWMNYGNGSNESLVQNENEMLQPTVKNAPLEDIPDWENKESNPSVISEIVNEASSDIADHINGNETSVNTTTGNNTTSGIKANIGNSGKDNPLTNIRTNSNSENKGDLNDPDKANTKASPSNERKNEFESSKPVAAISVSLTEGYAPLSVDFSNYGTIEKVRWDFDDGSLSTESNPTHVYNEPGIYKVILKVGDRIGQEVIDTVTIKALEENKSLIYPIPNIITPNGDGNNDIFIIPSENLKSLRIDIYTAQGNKVYDIDVVDGSWNGTDLSGVPLSNGVYYYIMDAMGKDGVTYSRRGSVTIKR